MTLTLEGVRGRQQATLFSSLDSAQRQSALEKCAAFLASNAAGYDYSREIALTDSHGLGETLLLESGGEIRAFAICHGIPLVQGRVREEIRILKLVARTVADVDELVTALCAYTRGLQRETRRHTSAERV